ncbi:MAG: NUDIX domain-containing protein, partial [Halocynthiibacter sp.]
GRSVSQDELRPSTLSDHAAYSVEDLVHPILIGESGQTARGLIFHAKGPDLARLDFYQGGLGRDLLNVVAGGQTESVAVYFPARGRTAAGAPWRLEDFEARHAVTTLVAARQLMALFGRIDPQEAALRRPMLERISARAVVHHATPPVRVRHGFDQGDVALAAHRRCYDGFFALDELELSHKRFDGGLEGPISRALFVSVDAAIVLPYDPARDRVLLVEQFRAGAFLRGDPHPWKLEPVAGRIDPGETPESAARREALEEAGLGLGNLVSVSAHYPSPGASTEFYHCFIGLCDLPDGTEGSGGLAAEAEDIRTHLLSFDGLMKLLESGEAEVGPLVLLALWLARHRADLRAAA